MPVKKTRRRSTPKLSTRLKKDPIGTAKTEVNKTGLFKYVIGASVLGAIGGTAMAVQMRKIPIVGGILSVAASKGARMVSPNRSR